MLRRLIQGVFVGPQIRKLAKDPQFLSTMTDVEKKAWLSFVKVVSKFLGNTKDPDYQNIVENMLACFQALGCRLSLKDHFYMHFWTISHKIRAIWVKNMVNAFTRTSKAWKHGSKDDGMYP